MEKLLNYVGKLKEDKDCFYKVCLYRILSLKSQLLVLDNILVQEYYFPSSIEKISFI